MSSSSPSRTTSTTTASDAGQALVEFVLMLIVLFAMVVGMIHISRLLTYDYWAQQQARFLAFEQTWVPAAYYEETGESPNDFITESNTLRRPKSVDRVRPATLVEDAGSLSSLISIASLSPTDITDPTISQVPTSASQTVLAATHRNSPESIWHVRTSDWFASIRDYTSVVKSAYAGIVGRDSDGAIDTPEYVDGPRMRSVRATDFQPDSLEVGYRTVLEQVDFGEVLCDGMSTFFRKRGFAPGVQAFSTPECGDEINNDFALHLSEHVSIKDVFRDYAYQVEGGVDHAEAIDRVVRLEVANQFYSFFDRAVALARPGAVPYILGVRADRGAGSFSSDIARMITDARYLGSSIAVTAVTAGQLGQIVASNPFSRDADSEKSLQDTVFRVLHADVPDLAFGLNPTYLPVPPTFLGGMSALQNAAMENVLRGGENAIGDFFGDPAGDDSDLIEPLIENSNKQATVAYDSGRGMYAAAARRFKRETRLTSRFFLVTQPWHIPRKVSPLGEFREIGTERDGIGEDTEEAMLRRRVAGLWLFPSAPTAFLRAPFEYFDAGGIADALDVISGFDSFIGTIKTMMIDNPLISLFDTLSEIPLIGNLVPTIPKFPAVRPAAYPGSTELRNQDHSPDDQLSGSVRNFSDYVEEQSYNPKAEPRFENDTFK